MSDAVMHDVPMYLNDMDMYPINIYLFLTSHAVFPLSSLGCTSSSVFLSESSISSDDVPSSVSYSFKAQY